MPGALSSQEVCNLHENRDRPRGPFGSASRELEYLQGALRAIQNSVKKRDGRIRALCKPLPIPDFCRQPAPYRDRSTSTIWLAIAQLDDANTRVELALARRYDQELAALVEKPERHCNDRHRAMLWMLLPLLALCAMILRT